MNSTIANQTVSGMNSSKIKFESVDSVLHFLKEPPPSEVDSTSSSVNSTKTNLALRSKQKIKKEKELAQANAEGTIQILPTGRVRYGPITVNPRKQPSKTLFTGRRSKYEQLNGDDEEKRRVRRERNRIAATKCREKREGVLSKLELDHLHESQLHTRLLQNVSQLEQRKQALQSMISTHMLDCTLPQINSIAIPPQEQPTMVFGDSTFLTSIRETHALPLPSHQPQLISHGEEECSNFLQPAPVLTNSVYDSDQSNYIYLSEQQSHPETITMYSSSIERLINSIESSAAYVDNNNNNNNNTSSGLFNSAYGSSTCAQQHSSSSEDGSLPPTKKNTFVC
ncbi:unnamed protein product [Adineta ricciae]|uniref:BZIP domain-containing protein n=1 Tax=Adineta ricciae TaxID=249248 RepID=A0A815PFI2_ADIRI|nr:unnamed protein product [Adineta ricciae]